MTLKPGSYYAISFLISAATCFVFVFSALQMYGDQDYVYNYLKCTPGSDSVAIPIFGFIVVSLFFAVVHVVAHVVFIYITKTKTKNRHFKVRFGFYKKEKAINWIIKPIFYIFASLFIIVYKRDFYKFYFFEALSYVLIATTVVLYSLTITNLIGEKKQVIDKRYPLSSVGQ